MIAALLTCFCSCSQATYQTVKTTDGRHAAIRLKQQSLWLTRHKVTAFKIDTIYIVPDFTAGEGFMFEYIKVK